jgi:phosphonate transport system permease protein
MSDAAGEGAAAALLGARRALRTRTAGALGVVALAMLVSAHGTQFDVPALLRGLPQIYDLATRMLPPDLTILTSLAAPLVETIQMALLGTTIAAALALPLSLLAAANTGPHPTVVAAARVLLNTLRTIPELVYALLLVAAVGLGPFPGVLAIILHATGGLGKFYAEAIESVRRPVFEALEATGAGRFKVIWFAVLPSCLPLILSNTLLYWEYNSRASTILGLVGAGGIGFAFTTAMQAFEYRKATMSLVLIVAILAGIDRISATLRARVT